MSKRFSSDFHIPKQDKEEFIQLFKQFISIKTVPFEAAQSGEYNRCVYFLESLVEKFLPDSEISILKSVENKPILVVFIEGTNSSLDCILLNSHYDVVPAEESMWNVDPFGGIEKDGKIFGRGTQDMKLVCLQYIFALNLLIKHTKSKSLNRSVFLSFVPDEEIGGLDGMGKFVESEYFLTRIKPNVGLAFDEGLANPENKFTIFNGERMPMWITVLAKGNTGHGSRFISNLAVEKILKVAEKAMKLRESQKKLLEEQGGCPHAVVKKLGDVLTLNLTMLQAGVRSEKTGEIAFNVIPSEATAGFDMRVPITMPMKEVKAILDSWCDEEGLSWKFENCPQKDHHVTELDKTCLWEKVVKKTLERCDLDFEVEIFPAATDSRYLRAMDIPAIGFSPMKNTPILLHEHNEYIEKDVFLEGVEVYAEVFKDLLAFDSSC